MPDLNDTAGILTEPIHEIECPHCDAALDISGNELFDVFDCPECGNELCTPGRFGQFILTEKLGQGGMGAVFLAIDEKLGREVALKVNRKEFGDNPKFLERFATEAQAMARFNHANVVQIYAYGQEYGQPYMVTEYVTGGDLASQMEEGVGLDQVAILHVARDLAEGLQAAKDNGLIHGDIKPENVMFDERGNAKIMDFGLAKFGGEGEGKPKEVWGTPYYIAPEKARKQGEDHLSDQYSLGAALYHTLAGHPPFEGDTPRDVVVARLKDDAPPLWQVNPDVSKKTSAIIERMMSRSPSARYPTYASMKADFAEAISFAEANPGPYIYEEEAPPKKPFPLLPVMLGAGGLLALVLGGIMIAGMDKKDPPKPGPGGGGTVASTNTVPAVPTMILKSDRTDALPFTSSQMKKLEAARTAFVEGKQFQGEQALFDALSKSDDLLIGRQWLNLFLAMNYQFKGEKKGASDHYAKVMNQKVEYTTGAPPAVNPVQYAKFLTGAINEDHFKSNTSGYPDRYKRLAAHAMALRRTQTTPATVAAAAKGYETGKAGKFENWVYVLQGQAKQLAAQAPRIDKTIQDAGKQKDKNRARGMIEGLKKDASLAKSWHVLFDREIKKYPKTAPPKKPPVKKPDPKKPDPKKPDPKPEPPETVTPEPPVTPPEPTVDPIQVFKAWQAAAQSAAKERDFEGIAAKLGDLGLDDPAAKEKGAIIRGIYQDMPATHGEIVKRGNASRLTRKMGSINAKLVGVSEEGVAFDLGQGRESTVPWSELTPDEYFTLGQQVFQRSVLPKPQRAKHLMTLAYLAKIHGNRRFGGVFAGAARNLDPSLAEAFRKL